MDPIGYTIRNSSIVRNGKETGARVLQGMVRVIDRPVSTSSVEKMVTAANGLQVAGEYVGKVIGPPAKFLGKLCKGAMKLIK